MATVHMREQFLDAFYRTYPDQYMVAYEEVKSRKPQTKPDSIRVIASIAKYFKEEFTIIHNRFPLTTSKSHGWLGS